MKNQIRAYLSSFNSKGFTLIELLVVIGILGVLASALVTTIDPFEQIKKAQDANVKNTIVEFLNGSIRYYTTHNALPWKGTAEGGGGCVNYPDGETALSQRNLGTYVADDTSGMKECVVTLINDGELKQGFTSATSILTRIYVNESSNNMTVCYHPSSKSQMRDPNTKFNQNGTLYDPSTGTDACVSQGGAVEEGCYWCAQ